MLKRLISLVCTAALLFACLPAALAADSGADTLSLEELRAWVEGFRLRALESLPLNDLDNGEHLTEDGYALVYDFATLYTDTPVLTEESVINELVIYSAEESCPRGVAVDSLAGEALAAYYNENAELSGSRDMAALYCMEALPDEARFARVLRDGQRIQSIQYTVGEQLAAGGEGYCVAGLLFTVQDDRVAAIRAYGLNSRVAAEELRTLLDDVEAVEQLDEYQQVPTSLNGLELTMFDRADLMFAGIDFANLTPEELTARLGACLDDLWMEDGNGEFVRTMELADCTATFTYDENKQNPRVDMLTIAKDGLEGPRAVRVGDTISSVMSRFRSGEGVYEGSTETLYGTVGQAPYGLADYGSGMSTALYYAAALEDGRTAVLFMSFSQIYLSEIILYFE